MNDLPNFLNSNYQMAGLGTFLFLSDLLRIYQPQDGWTNKAKNALERIEKNIPADKSFSIHH